VPSFVVQPFTFGKVTAAVGGVALPLVVPSNIAALPYANTRQIVILNTGVNPLLFGVQFCSTQADWPSNFGGAGAAIVPVEGFNCTRVPAGGSLTLDIGSLQDRGNMGVPNLDTAAPVPPGPVEFPFTLIFFSSLVGPTTADVTYVNRLGLY
jgi:hypothetical protein